MTARPYGVLMSFVLSDFDVETVVSQGADVQWSAVSALLVEAQRRGIDPMLIDLVGDVDAPLVVRHRALAKVMAAVRHDGADSSACCRAAATVIRRPHTAPTGRGGLRTNRRRRAESSARQRV